MDIEVLSLHKQHYLDHYIEPLKSDYSCWGYYDGLSIRQVDMTQLYQSRLIEGQNENRAHISQQWYAAANNLESLNGGFSQQNIPIFRSFSKDSLGKEPPHKSDELPQLFYQEEECMPFIGVAFLQLRDALKYSDVRKEFEKDQYWKWDSADFNKDEGNGYFSCTEERVRAMFFTSFDNDDMILVLHSNCLKKLEDSIHLIEDNAEVKYLHSVLGIKESFLTFLRSEVEKGNTDPGCFCIESGNDKNKRVKIFLDEEIFRLRIRMVTSGERSIIQKEIRYLITQNEKYHFTGFDLAATEDFPRFALVNGHEDLIFEMGPTDVYTMLSLLTHKGFSTHQNPGYEKNTEDENQNPCLYNMETVYTRGFTPMRDGITDVFSDWNSRKIPDINTLWCRSKIRHYQRKLAERRKINIEKSSREDEALYADLQAIIRTLNMLTQYEETRIADDVFYLVYPSFRMFCKKFDYALALAESMDHDIPLAQTLEEVLNVTKSVKEDLAKSKDTIKADDIDKQLDEIDETAEYLRKNLRKTGWMIGQENNLRRSITREKIYDKLKQACNDYLEAVNAVIYHTIHTDQMFLMVPGYSGSSFTIPIKITLLFQWVAKQILTLLQTNRDYECILEPSMEASPKTQNIFFGDEIVEKSRKEYLVRIRVSERSLYLPRDLMIIVTHEMGHYIGGRIRKRDLRAEQVAKAVSYRFFWYIFPRKESLQHCKNQKCYDCMAETVFKYCFDELESAIKEKEKSNRYYGVDVTRIITTKMTGLLTEFVKVEAQQNLMNALTSNLEKQNISLYEEDFPLFAEILSAMSDNCLDVLQSNRMIKDISWEMDIMREIFSDMIVLVVLNIDASAFKQSESISEGVRLAEGDRYVTELGLVRNMIYNCLASGKKIAEIPKGKMPEDHNTLMQYLNRIRYDYVYSCREEIEQWISDNPAKSNQRKTLRDMYDTLKKHREDDPNPDPPADVIYRSIIEKIAEMKTQITLEKCSELCKN